MTDDLPRDRESYRAFVRRHHPDVGGDPELFRRGVAAFRAAESERLRAARDPGTPGTAGTPGTPGRTIPDDWLLPDDDPRLDAPVTARDGHALHRWGRAGRRLLHRGPDRVDPRVRAPRPFLGRPFPRRGTGRVV